MGNNLQFPLDFIWIDDNKVVDITENVPVLIQGTIPTIKPKEPINKVLEVNAGEIAAAHIQIGDTVYLQK